MADKVKIQFEIDEKLALKAINNFDNKFDKFAKNTKKGLEGIRFDVIAGNLIASGIGKSLDFLQRQFTETFNAAIEFESGLVEVAKTSNLTDEEIAKLGKEIENISLVVPVSTRALLANAKVAAQLGVVGSKNILKYAETIAKLGKVSNLEGEFAASTLARILNITKEGNETIETFASVIVSLGNNFAATEAEIAAVTNQVARATAQFGVSSAEAAALATVLRSIGVRAEEAGGVISKTFLAISKAVALGGKKFEQLEKITGESGDALRKQFGEEPIQLFQKFVVGLERMRKEGKILNTELKELGIAGLRVDKVLPPLAANAGEFARALALANAEVQNATALNNEFNRSLKTGESQVQLLDNAVEKLQRQIGDNLVSALKDGAPLLLSLVQRLSETRFEAFAKGTEDVQELTEAIAQLTANIDRANANKFAPTALIEEHLLMILKLLLFFHL